MLSGMEFIKKSLGLHLFFARIMKEHAFFLEVGFTPRDSGFTRQADAFRREFDTLLADAISISNGVVDNDVLRSGEVVTPYTLDAETVTSRLTGIQIPTQLTQAELELKGDGMTSADPWLEERVMALNRRVINATNALIEFKKRILTNVLSCEMFAVNYPLLILHIIREAELYAGQLQRLQNREDINLGREALQQEFFWNRQMAEHAKFIRGLLDPTENELFRTANSFGNEFDRLTADAKAALDAASPANRVTEESLRATINLRDFKEQGTKGILDCKVRSIIIPLLGDHVLREANHSLRLLRMFDGQR